MAACDDVFISGVYRLGYDPDFDTELKSACYTGMQRFLNMVGGCRPSDAMRSEIYRLGTLGRDEYITEIHASGEALRKQGY